MNEAESERIAAALEKEGFQLAKKIEESDLVIINTCSVRQSAEDRVFGLIKNLSEQKEKPKIILTGCMVGSVTGNRRRFGLKELKRKLPQVDEFIEIEKLVGSFKGIFPPSHKASADKHAFVPIMKGCDNFCTYCVVPYSRGQEKSRLFDEIVEEVECLAKKGYRHITLLGQNVNSYQNSKFKIKNAKLQCKIQNLRKKYNNNFAVLLAFFHEIQEIEKISFITSNPWDLTDDIIEAMELPKIDRCLHLPVQSGDDKILQRMNRPYTVKQYMKLVEKIRRKIPDIKISTDIIIGFPGETKKAFENTVKLCKKVGFEKAYIAKYSPRQGTAAYKMKDSVLHQEKKRRWKILDSLINQSG